MTRRKRRGIGVAIGGVLVGFDQQIFKTLPPAEELVHHAQPDGPVASEGGDLITIRLPEPLEGEGEGGGRRAGGRTGGGKSRGQGADAAEGKGADGGEGVGTGNGADAVDIAGRRDGGA